MLMKVHVGGGGRALGAVMGAVAVCSPALPAIGAIVDRNIEGYVLFALEEIDFKGRNGGDPRGIISGGHVGVNRVDPTPGNSDFLISMGGASAVVVMSDGSQLVGDSVRLSENADVYDLFANDVNTAFNPGSVRNSGPNAFSAPIIAPEGLPQIPAFSPGDQDIEISSDTSLALSPGDYGEIHVHDDGELFLGSGVYNISNLRCGRRVTIHTTNATILQIAEDMHFNNDSFIGTSPGATFLLRSDGVASNDSTVTFGRRTTFYGQVIALNGRVNLGHSTDLFGRFWAESFGSDFNVNITYMVPPIPAPGAAAMLALAGLGAARRRRG